MGQVICRSSQSAFFVQENKEFRSGRVRRQYK